MVACNEPEPITPPDTTIKSLGTPADNEIWFTTIDGRELMALDDEAFNCAIVDIEYSDEYSEFDTFTFHFHALEKEMATHSRVLAWRIPGTGEPGGLPSMGLHRVRHD